MTQGRRCFTLWLIAAAVSIPVLIKGRESSHRGEDAAFLPLRREGTVIRIVGEVPHPGIYNFCDASSNRGVTKMTDPIFQVLIDVYRCGNRSPHDGDVVLITANANGGKSGVFSKMNALDRMTIGIPLDLNSMTQPEWEQLDGIGPKTAEAIVMYRQKYGGFGNIDELETVPGLGKKRIQKIKSSICCY